MVDGADLDELLTLFAAVTSPTSAATLRRRISQQVLRAVEIGMLADPAVIDIALNPGLYLGRETQVLTERLADVLGTDPPSCLVRHLRSLVLSKAAGAAQKTSARRFEEDVLRQYRLSTDTLRCLDCGYHFVEGDLGQGRLDVVHGLGFVLATEKLARRLRDPWKPSGMSSLSIDHLVPEAGLGPTTPENLRVACQFCNGEKRIYRWPGEAAPRDVAAALLALGESPRGAWAVRATTYVAILDSGGRCVQCRRSTADAELTARPFAIRGRAATVPWDMQAVCYDCYDPAA